MQSNSMLDSLSRDFTNKLKYKNINITESKIDKSVADKYIKLYESAAGYRLSRDRYNALSSWFIVEYTRKNKVAVMKEGKVVSTNENITRMLAGLPMLTEAEMDAVLPDEEDEMNEPEVNEDDEESSEDTKDVPINIGQVVKIYVDGEEKQGSIVAVSDDNGAISVSVPTDDRVYDVTVDEIYPALGEDETDGTEEPAKSDDEEGKFDKPEEVTEEDEELDADGNPIKKDDELTEDENQDVTGTNDAGQENIIDTPADPTAPKMTEGNTQPLAGYAVGNVVMYGGNLKGKVVSEDGTMLTVKLDNGGVVTDDIQQFQLLTQESKGRFGKKKLKEAAELNGRDVLPIDTADTGAITPDDQKNASTNEDEETNDVVIAGADAQQTAPNKAPDTRGDVKKIRDLLTTLLDMVGGEAITESDDSDEDDKEKMTEEEETPVDSKVGTGDVLDPAAAPADTSKENAIAASDASIAAGMEKIAESLKKLTEAFGKTNKQVLKMSEDIEGIKSAAELLPNTDTDDVAPAVDDKEGEGDVEDVPAMITKADDVPQLAKIAEQLSKLTRSLRKTNEAIEAMGADIEVIKNADGTEPADITEDDDSDEDDKDKAPVVAEKKKVIAKK